LGFGRGANNSSLLRNIQIQNLGPGLILWYDPSNGKGARDFVLGMLGAYTGHVHLQQQAGN